ncbi:MAG: cysteine desulfurase [Armatimonadetes bacterium]|nr:cysteine desulfurase [Armatimonadota bacterium]
MAKDRERPARGDQPLVTPPCFESSPVAFDIEKIRSDFPILKQRVHGKPLVYLDNAATTQKPRSVIDAIVRYYEEENSNIHRGIHYLSERATHDYECARCKVRFFLNAEDEREIIFVRGATEGINLVAQSYGRKRFKQGDEILITAMEHHSNIVPWQMLCEVTGAVLRVAPINDQGELIMEEFEKLVTPKTRLVSVTYVSNALGTVNPVKRITEMAHRQNVPVLVDGAQAAAHAKVDVRDLDCDFFVFSSHKTYGPTGVGILYGRASLLEEMPPYQGGGDMISAVSFEKTLYNRLPFKFEAGTPNIAGGMGLSAAIDYVHGIGLDNVAAYEKSLLAYATESLSQIKGLRIIGTAREKAGVLSFVLENAHPHDIGTILDQEGVAIRAGHHCAQPVMQRFGVPATARASFALYNTKAEIDALVAAIQKVREVFS